MVWSVLGSFALYLATALAVSRITDQAGWMMAILHPDAFYPPWSRPIVLLFGLSGVAIALIVPAMPWAALLARGRLRPASLFHRSFALNLIQATAFVSLWKASAGHVPPGSVFIAWQMLVAALGLVVLSRGPGKHRAVKILDDSRFLRAGVFAILIVLPTLLWGKTFIENRSGDGTESWVF
jgi:hypothetical protein